MPEHDMDEPVNTDMEPEEALRVLLGEERKEQSDDRESEDEDSSVT